MSGRARWCGCPLGSPVVVSARRSRPRCRPSACCPPTSRARSRRRSAPTSASGRRRSASRCPRASSRSRCSRPGSAASSTGSAPRRASARPRWRRRSWRARSPWSTGSFAHARACCCSPCGLVNGIAQLASSATVAGSVPARRQGIAFGVKEAAKPAATLLCGFAVPLVDARRLALGVRGLRRARAGAAGAAPAARARARRARRGAGPRPRAGRPSRRWSCSRPAPRSARPSARPPARSSSRR